MYRACCCGMIVASSAHCPGCTLMILKFPTFIVLAMDAQHELRMRACRRVSRISETQKTNVARLRSSTSSDRPASALYTVRCRSELLFYFGEQHLTLDRHLFLDVCFSVSSCPSVLRAVAETWLKALCGLTKHIALTFLAAQVMELGVRGDVADLIGDGVPLMELGMFMLDFCLRALLSRQYLGAEGSRSWLV